MFAGRTSLSGKLRIWRNTAVDGTGSRWQVLYKHALWISQNDAKSVGFMVLLSGRQQELASDVATDIYTFDFDEVESQEDFITDL